MYAFIKTIWQDQVFSKVIAAAIVALLAALGTYFLSWTALNSLYVLAVLALTGALWLSCFYLYFRRRAFGQTLGLDEVKLPAHSKRTRNFALAGILSIPIIVTAAFGAWNFYQGRSSEQVVVLVANFDGPDPQNYRVQDIIIGQLRAATKKYYDIQIRSLPETFTEQQGSELARAKGKQEKANIVIWGWYGRTGERGIVTIHFETLAEPGRLALKSDEKTLNLAASELETYTIQERLSSDMSYLVLLTLGISRYEVDDYDGAIDRISTALNLPVAPEQMFNTVILYEFRGNVYLLKNDFDKALLDFNEAIKLKPDYYSALVQRGSIHAIKGDITLAFADLNQAISYEPDTAQAYLARGSVYLQTKNLEASLADFNHAIAIQSDFGQAYTFRGIAYFMMGNLESAMVDLDRGVELESASGSAYRHRGEAHFKKGNLNQAISDFNQAVEFGPDDAENYLKRGAAYFTKGDKTQAFADIHQALRINPKYADAYFLRALAYSDQGEDDSAISDFNQAINLNPNASNYFRNRGLTYLKKREFAHAITDLTQAIKLKPDDSKYYTDRGIAYGEKGDSDSAIMDFNQAIKINPNDAEAYYGRGYEFKVKGDLDRAISDLAEAIRLKPDYCEAYHMRGVSYTIKEHANEAVFDLRKALELCEDTDRRKEIETILKEAELKADLQ